MSETTTLKVGGAEVTVETSALFGAWFEKHLGGKTPIQAPANKFVSFPQSREGEKYVGAVTEPSGRMRHIFLLPGDEKKNWKDGLQWAKDLGGDLPDRVEQAMLHAYLPDEFKQEAYWSNMQHAGYSSLAWFQNFTNGYQDNDFKSAERRVRAVRREGHVGLL